MNKPNRFHFRAWDKTYERMCGPAGCCCAYKLCPATMILMQSTGLCDSKGVEIFEGDVVDVGNKATAGGAFDRRGIVEWHSLFYSWSVYLGGRYRHLCECSPIKVVGNIYQNPELLK